MNSKDIIDIDVGTVDKRLGNIEKLLTDPAPLMQQIAGLLEAETEANFEAQGRPSWVPLAESTKSERLKRNKGGSVLRILQDRGILAASISSAFGSDFAQIGAGGAAAAYAGIHQFGGTIEVEAHEATVRHRLDAKGNLVRNGNRPNLAVFAKDSHKRVRETKVEVGEHTITIPARPYLPFRGPPGAMGLQPEAEKSLLELTARILGDAAT